ncbi:dnaJ homolog subfamily B member 14-like isoform X2 [Sipha flava]|uniref:DnaJ homolog subfamily B member 14-like isoform X2 n=1 Tax=Sipha flava TaxID=143950 RepID=A0A8B8GDE5_9HEMI|nr:dnaJ homolog subfamily B member 14-like isoform X2 [Sipha flava]
MEGNRDEASRCIELTKLYIKKKDLDNAWKFSVKAHKLFPSNETRRLMLKLKSKLRNQKCRTMKKNQSMSGTAYSYEMFKEINKDESYNCLEKAEQCIKRKEYGMAEKYVLKSKKLFATTRADELLQELKKIQEDNKPKYTEEQANVVRKVKNSENYYTMLDIKYTATVPEIKKAYKKLALLLHPDKNPAPGSGEVFIVVSNAVDTLSDCKKRRTYDLSIRKPSISTSSYTRNNCFYNRYEPPYGAHRNPYKFYQRPCDSSDEFEDTEYVSETEDTFDYYESFE